MKCRACNLNNLEFEEREGAQYLACSNCGFTLRDTFLNPIGYSAKSISKVILFRNLELQLERHRLWEKKKEKEDETRND